MKTTNKFFLTYRKEVFYEGVGVDDRKIFKWIKGNSCQYEEWVDSAQIRDYWKALVYAALNLPLP